MSLKPKQLLVPGVTGVYVSPLPRAEALGLAAGLTLALSGVASDRSLFALGLTFVLCTSFFLHGLWNNKNEGGIGISSFVFNLVVGLWLALWIRGTLIDGALNIAEMFLLVCLVVWGVSELLKEFLYRRTPLLLINPSGLTVGVIGRKLLSFDSISEWGLNEENRLLRIFLNTGRIMKFRLRRCSPDAIAELSVLLRYYSVQERRSPYVSQAELWRDSLETYKMLFFCLLLCLFYLEERGMVFPHIVSW